MFSAEWLALREPADAAARSPALVKSIAGSRNPAAPLRVLDLGAGTGANARYLIDRLPLAQDWLLVDHDASLLSLVPARMSAWARERSRTMTSDEHGVRVSGPAGQPCSLATRRTDLASLDDSSVFEQRDLITASALLDLVSDAWLRQLARRCREAGAAVLFALTYDGRMECDPADPEDAAIRDLVNRHQRTDKGFGPALGPSAIVAAERCLAAEGYRVGREPSDWQLTPDLRELQRQLICGWAEAATELGAEHARTIAEWRRRRLAFVERGASRLVVGHEDLAAVRE